ncbi:MAG: hypothetical protein J6Z22_06850 [Lachnospiraceae bacterium]|nr:hypothetical protein [Lachnospiraceae bacterium]
MMGGMTKKPYIFALLLLAVACKGKDDPVKPVVPDTVTLSLTASMEAVTSAGVDGNGLVVWQTGDRIAVLLDDGSVTALTLESGAGTTSATFTGEIPGARSFAGKAGYPWWDGAWSSSAGELVLTLPESMEWPGDDYVPTIMKANASGDVLPFRHDGAIMKITIKNMPARAASFKFSSSGGSVMGRDDFTYSFTPQSATRVFHVPVNAGTLPSYKVSINDASGSEIASKTKNKTTEVARADYRELTPLGVEKDDEIRVLCYNILNGMESDSANGYSNFVSWVVSQAPDVLIMCEAGNIEQQAYRWGHSYTAKVSMDSFPVVITSSRPLSIKQRITNAEKVKHGAVHVAIGRYDIVGLHLRPTINDDGLNGISAEEYAKYGALRKDELEYIMAQTVDNPSYSGIKNWIVCGDFNAYSPLEKTAVSPYKGKSAYYYPEPTASVCYEVYPVIANKLTDVIYYKGGTAFKPTMYHGLSRLDYMFVSEGLYGSVTEADVILGGFAGNYCEVNKNTNPSDHLPMYMDITIFTLKALDGLTRLEDWPDEDLFNEN